MSLRIKQYRLVSRDYLIQLFRETSEECECKYCRKVLSIKSELKKLKKNDSKTFKKAQWFKIEEGWSSLNVIPVIGE